MIDLNDFKLVKNGPGRLRHYRMRCDKCNMDRGYKRKRDSDRLCTACSKRGPSDDNIDITDFITKNYKGNTAKRYYRTKCKKCGGDKGYQSSTSSKQLCNSCKMLELWSRGGMSHAKTAKRKFEYTNNKGVFIFKSSWELAYAQYLDIQNIVWEYEPIFKLLDGRSILPDFQLSTGDIIEIKGYWWSDSKEKWDLFCSEYPEINKRVLMKTDLQQLGIL